MNGGRVSRHQHVEFPESVSDGPAVEARDDLTRIVVHVIDITDVTVVNLLVVVIFDLHHFITGRKCPAETLDLAIAGWGPDYDDPYTYMQYWQTSSTDMGTTFDNADYDKLLQQANNEMDPKKRAELLAQAEALFSDIGTSIPLLHYKGEAALQPRVKNMLTSSFGVSLNYIWVDIQK